jgi:methylenetetrahydrofolate dehydrogenase (NADP+) / methenyltetrahydrofolate cyclohydrolase
MKVIDGKAIATDLELESVAVANTLRGRGLDPTLAVVVPTADEATQWYVRSIERTAARVGVTCRVDQMTNTDSAALIARLQQLSADPSVHGIICQTPLPQGASLEGVGAFIAPEKDVDGANPESLGRLAAGLPAFAPATAAAVMHILRREGTQLYGRRAVVVGRSTVVGKPVALLLLAEDATVTICHSKTIDLVEICAEADVLVVAVGKSELVTGEFIKPGATVIDVGTNPTPDGGLVGDVNAELAARTAGALTPVPGGIGPVTTMLLVSQTLLAAGAA